MYERFYGLQKSPFMLTPDPRFMVMTEAHCNAKAGLIYAILGGKGFTVLTGDAGTGKTTLLRSVINSIPAEKICFSLVLNPDLTPNDFSDMAVSDFGLPRGMAKTDRLRKLQHFLLEVDRVGKIAVLFVDEAHRLSIETLEEIRLLTNFETETKKLLQIVLVGQDELDELLDRRELRQLKQRVEVRLHVGPLSAQEVGLYITHRWRCAGTSAPPFSSEAIRRIGQMSGGIPRVVNTICDNALLLGFAEGSPVITEEHTLEAGRDLHLTIATDRGVIHKIESKTAAREASPDRHLSEPYEKSTLQKAEDKAPATMELRIPPPVFQRYSDNPLSLFCDSHKPKRGAWARFRRAENA
jgi:general secretion pathway protein A